MSDFFLGQIQMMSFAFAPRSWAQCSGQLLPINQYQALFSLLGTQFGGNGTSTFALPDLRGRTPVGQNSAYSTYPIGERAGVEHVTLTIPNLPAHNHAVQGTSSPATTRIPKNNLFANNAAVAAYAPVEALTPLSAQSTAIAGGSQPHSNMQPFTVLNFCIALQGIYPSRS